MNASQDRDQRFIDAWSRWYSEFVAAILRTAARLLPCKAYGAAEKLAVDTAEPAGRFVGWVYCNVRDAGDILCWLVLGRL
jgi:hypothetical protein